jgi:hypothetical protein
MDDLLTVLRLQERVDKLERQALEHWFLIAVLLGRSGLDADGVDRAFTFASTSIDSVTDKMAAERLATPEGQEQYRQMEEKRREHMRNLWREECREDGRIYRDPTT